MTTKFDRVVVSLNFKLQILDEQTKRLSAEFAGALRSHSTAVQFRPSQGAQNAREVLSVAESFAREFEALAAETAQTKFAVQQLNAAAAEVA